MKKMLRVCVAGLSLAFFSGCEIPKMAGIPSLQVPVYEQNHPVPVLDPIVLSISRSYWTDEFEKAGFDRVPKQFREQQRNLFVVKPQNKFLVIDLVAANTGTRTAEWRSDQPPLMNLERSDGSTVYAPEGEINQEDLTGKIMSQRGILNPGRTLTGKLVFDVPKGDYLLRFAFASETHGTVIRGGKISFKWRLQPTEKP